MENNQKEQQGNQPQRNTGEQNPTLNEKGTSVSDYGNVMGGSSNDNVEEGQQRNQQSNDQRSKDNNDTIGNP